MYSLAFSILFLSLFVLTLALRFWLAARQLRHVLANRSEVPPEFAEKIPLEAHQKAADYTAAKTSFGLVTLLFSSAVLVGFTVLGGLQWLSQTILPLSGPGMAYQIALQGDQALLQILKDTRSALHQLKPMPLEQVVVEGTEATEVASE